MKKALHIAAALAVGAAGLSACGNSEKDNFAFSSYEFTTVAEGADSDSLRSVMKDFDGRWSVTLSGILPERLGDRDVSQLRDTVMAMACLKADESGKLEPDLSSDLRPISDKAQKEKKSDPGSIFRSEVALDLLTPDFAVFRISNYSFPEGAPHGGFATGYINYDIRNGKILRLSSVLTPGFEKMLKPAIFNRLSEEGLEMLVEADAFPMPHIYRFTLDGIEFVYGLYEIAPYSAGEPTVLFYYPELESILRPEAKKRFL